MSEAFLPSFKVHKDTKHRRDRIRAIPVKKTFEEILTVKTFPSEDVLVKIGAEHG
jgi:hypothetical protein